jgi:hypothetical protein
MKPLSARVLLQVLDTVARRYDIVDTLIIKPTNGDLVAMDVVARR